MNKKIKKNIKLTGLLIGNEKKLMLCSFVSVIVGFTFMFMVSSLSGTIIKTKQDNTVNKYGKFLMVLPDIDNESEKEIKQKCIDFKYEHFGVVGNVEYANKKITIGTMTEDMGATLAFKLIKGKWVKGSDQIVVEEYLLKLFGKENTQLPFDIKLKKDGRFINYKVTGVISNYSSVISTSYDKELETKVYPSIICGQKNDKDVKNSLVILQKKLDFKKAKSDIENVLFQNISEEAICANEKLHWHGYSDNEDMININIWYPILLGIMLLLEQAVVIRAFVIRNQNTFHLFQVLGMTTKEIKRLFFYIMQIFIWFGVLTGYILSVIIGNTYISNVFGEYGRYYLSSLNNNVLIMMIVFAMISICSYFILMGIEQHSRLFSNNNFRKNRKYRFRKIDISIIIVQTVCIFFTIASFYFMNTFSCKSENIEYYLCSKSEASAYPLRGYYIETDGEEYFGFDVLNVFDKYKDKISMSIEAETKRCSILLDKNNVDEYFKNYIKENRLYSLDESDAETKEKNNRLWKQVSVKTEKYKPVSDNVLVTVLREKEFKDFVKKKEIKNPCFENNKSKSCIVILPDYKEIASPSIKENGMIRLGGIRGDEEKVRFYSEKFNVGAVLSGSSEEYNGIEIVMDEKTAIKSRTVLGCNTITIEMKKDAPLFIQKEVDKNVMFTMASIQGGLLDSSENRESDDKLMAAYTSVLSNTILLFCAIIICIYINLSIYIDWEKHRYEYGVLRSFGMSYAQLQRKVFFRYSSSILFACALNMFLGKYAFTNGTLTSRQIIVSVGLTVGITYVCRLISYYRKKDETVSRMLSEGE